MNYISKLLLQALKYFLLLSLSLSLVLRRISDFNRFIAWNGLVFLKTNNDAAPKQEALLEHQLSSLQWGNE